MATPTLLVYGDVGTMSAARVESYLYRSSVDWTHCSKQAVLGHVSRYAQHYIVSFMPTLTASFSENQKAEFVVIIALFTTVSWKTKEIIAVGRFPNRTSRFNGKQNVCYFSAWIQ